MQMPMVIVGGQWGDEGKGKIVNLLSDAADLVGRYQGGHNAGHTVTIGGNRYALHLVPSGILAAGKTCVIGNGIVIDPEALVTEIRGLKASGIDLRGLRISDRAHFILPHHVLLDQLREQRRGSEKIGTTGRGIGPCYESKYNREGVRAVFLKNPDLLRAELVRLSESKNRHLKAVFGHDGIAPEEVVRRFEEMAPEIEPLVTDTAALVQETIRSGKRVLCEGAQGTLLDVDHGTYPFVTSSNSTAGGACTGLGIPPTDIRTVIGVYKAYCTRVGEGPFVTEQKNETGDLIRERGHEYGTTTGRPRRCGWFDAVAARYSVRLNGMEGIALTLLDVLDAFDEVKVCVAYDVNGERLTDFPAAPWILETAIPVYETLPGWRREIYGTTDWDALPSNAKSYVHRLEALTGVPVAILSTGPDRAHTIVRDAGLRGLLGQ
ncbi:MAG: adenylosuccinate synthase [Acidobacteriota bacterium]